MGGDQEVEGGVNDLVLGGERHVQVPTSGEANVIKCAYIFHGTNYCVVKGSKETNNSPKHGSVSLLGLLRIGPSVQ